MSTKHKRRINRRNIALLVFILLGFVVILPSLPAFEEALKTLYNADFAYIWLSVFLWLSTFFSAALVYKSISLKPLKYGATLLVQMASGFTNRLAPLGAGIVALNVDYLIKRKHTVVQASTVVALNNILGFLGMAVLLIGAAALSHETLKLQLNISTKWVVVIALCLIAGLVAALIFGSKFTRQIKNSSQMVFRMALRKPQRLLSALAASMAITVGYAGTLFAIGLAFNVHFSVTQALWVLTLGVVSASITPTPGGIGGAEVGLIAALAAIGVASHQALTIALIYRFITYWLPILPGFACFQFALRKKYI